MNIIDIILIGYVIVVVLSAILIINKIRDTDDFTVGFLMLSIFMSMVPPIAISYIIEEYGIDLYPHKAYNTIQSIMDIKLLNKKHAD